MYLFPLLDVMGKHPHISEYIFTSFVVLGSMVVQSTTFVFLFFYRPVSIGFSLVDCIPCLLMCRCAIPVFVKFSICFLMSFSVSPDQVFRKPCLIDFSRISFVLMKSAACIYCYSSSLFF